MSDYFAGNKEYATAFEALRLDFIERLKTTITDLAEFEKKVIAGELSENDYERMYFMVHGLTGTGATFGFPEISKTAAIAENLFRTTEKDSSIILGSFAALKQSCVEANHYTQADLNASSAV